VADELVVATVLAAVQQQGARAPSLLLMLDLGTYGKQEAVLSVSGYEGGELEGTQILVRRDAEGAVVVAAHSHGHGVVPLRPLEDVEPGTLVS
jgi:hypothetical protein